MESSGRESETVRIDTPEIEIAEFTLQRQLAVIVDVRLEFLQFLKVAAGFKHKDAAVPEIIATGQEVDGGSDLVFRQIVLPARPPCH